MVAPSGAYAHSVTTILAQAGLVTPEQVEAGLLRQRETGRRIGETLVEMGAVTEEDLAWSLAKQLGLQFVDLHPDAIDRDLVASFPEGVLRRIQAVPLVRLDTGISMALADPTDGDGIRELQEAAGTAIAPSVATQSAIDHVLDALLGERPYHHTARRAASPENAHYDIVWDRSGATFLRFHLTRALREGATELHFIPRDGELRVFHRLAGGMAQVSSEPFEVVYSLLARIEALGGPAIHDRVVHASGQAVCPMGTADVLLDVSLLNFDDGVAITLGIRPQSGPMPTLETLGLDPLDLSRVRAALDERVGLVLVSGPARSGCSTTLACLLAAIDQTASRSIAFSTHPGPPVPAGIRLALDTATARAQWQDIVVAQNADAVVLDDVLSGESVCDALSSAGSGRRLFVSTDWADTFLLLDHLMQRPAFRPALAARLRFMIQQRMLHVAPDETSRPGPPAAPRAVFEVLMVTDAMRESLHHGAGASAIRELAAADGFRPIRAQVQSLVANKRVTAAEAARALS